MRPPERILVVHPYSVLISYHQHGKLQLQEVFIEKHPYDKKVGKL